MFQENNWSVQANGLWLTGSQETPQASEGILGSYLISVCGSASMEGGPLVRRDGFTNTPWPGGQRKYTRSWTVPLCFPAEEFINITFGISIF